MFIHLHDLRSNRLVYVYMPLIERIEHGEIEIAVASGGSTKGARITMNSGDSFGVRESAADIIRSIARANNSALQAAEAAANGPREPHRGTRG